MLMCKIIVVIYFWIGVVLYDLFVMVLLWWIVKVFCYVLMFDVVVIFFVFEFFFVLMVQGFLFMWMGLYKGVWCFVSLLDFWNIFCVVVLGSFVIGLVLFFYNWFVGVLCLVLLLYLVVLVILFGVLCLVYWFWKDSWLDLFELKVVKWVLIVGVDWVGEVLLCDLCCDSCYLVVGFVDDQGNLCGVKIVGYFVFGMLDQLLDVVCEMVVEMLLIVLLGVFMVQMCQVVELCDSIGLLYCIVLCLEDVVVGCVYFNEIKEVVIEDLFGCDVVELDWIVICENFIGWWVLVIGGGGLIGLELCWQIVWFGVQVFIVVENSEYNLYCIIKEFVVDYLELIFNGVLVDCSDCVVMSYVFVEYCFQVVFYVVVYKYVLLLQNQLCMGFCNNVLVMCNVVEMVYEYVVECFVLIFIDKVVNFISVMGVCKCIVEIWCQNFSVCL